MDFWTKRQAGVWTFGLNVRQAYGLLDIPTRDMQVEHYTKLVLLGCKQRTFCHENGE